MFIAHSFPINPVKKWDFVLTLETPKRINEVLAEHGESDFSFVFFRKAPA